MTTWFCFCCGLRHDASTMPAMERQLLPSGLMLRACARLLEPYADVIREQVEQHKGRAR